MARGLSLDRKVLDLAKSDGEWAFFPAVAAVSSAASTEKSLTTAARKTAVYAVMGARAEVFMTMI